MEYVLNHMNPSIVTYNNEGTYKTLPDQKALGWCMILNIKRKKVSRFREWMNITKGAQHRLNSCPSSTKIYQVQGKRLLPHVAPIGNSYSIFHTIIPSDYNSKKGLFKR